MKGHAGWECCCTSYHEVMQTCTSPDGPFHSQEWAATGKCHHGHPHEHQHHHYCTNHLLSSAPRSPLMTTRPPQILHFFFFFNLKLKFQGCRDAQCDQVSGSITSRRRQNKPVRCPDTRNHGPSVTHLTE